MSNDKNGGNQVELDHLRELVKARNVDVVTLLEAFETVSDDLKDMVQQIDRIVESKRKTRASIRASITRTRKST